MCSLFGAYIVVYTCIQDWRLQACIPRNPWTMSLYLQPTSLVKVNWTDLQRPDEGVEAQKKKTQETPQLALVVLVPLLLASEFASTVYQP